MTRPALEVADVVRTQGRRFLQRYQSCLSYQQLKAYRAVERCRTAALGGHKDQCVDCQYQAPISYNSCRSRCCPKCQARARRLWLQTQQRDLINTNYFHVVFTVPHQLNPLGLTSPSPFLDLLFDASSQTLLEVAADPQHLGAEIGFLSILHTWSSNLLAHYHIHAVVPAGGLSVDHQRWIHTSHPMFLLPIPTLRTVFRDKFLAGLRQLYRKGLLHGRGPAADFRDPAWFQQLINQLEKKDWYVYAKPPFGGPEHVLRYLGRYTHRMAISNHRLIAFDGEHVTFRWRDYAHGGKQRVMTLDAVNFLSRFFLHVLPKGFVLHPALWPAVKSLPHTAVAPGTHTTRRPGPRAAVSAAPPQLRTLALSPLRHANACHPALHRITTLFRRLRLLMTAVANPRRRLASRTYPLECVHSTQNSFMSTSHAIPERLDCRSRIELITARPHHRRR